MGGRCCLCGYDRCLEALVFHHLSGAKEFGIGAKGYTRSWSAVREELAKCLLVCANCHSEIHAGLHDVAALVSNGQWKTGRIQGNRSTSGGGNPEPSPVKGSK
jgi:hypothetical protein